MIRTDIISRIGDTPLVRLDRIPVRHGVKLTLLAKLERSNPGGSSKDRVALSIIEDAVASGRLQKGGTIVEATSGNTGVGLAMVAAALGYRVVLTMPENMSVERQRILTAYGARIELTPAKDGMAGAVQRAEAIKNETENSILAAQFDNPANPAAHYRTTGPELWQAVNAQMQGNGHLDAFIACIGTGGTVSGTGRYLKEQDPSIRVFGVEPAESPLLSKGYAGPHGIQGIGANFVPKALDQAVLDGVQTVSTQEAFAFAQELAEQEGVFCGISSGAAVAAAIALAKEDAFSGKTIVVLLPDTGERYLSSGVFR